MNKLDSFQNFEGFIKLYPKLMNLATLYKKKPEIKS